MGSNLTCLDLKGLYLFVGLEVQKVGFVSKKWLLKPKIAQKVNGIDQIVNDHFLG
jgi:hypothetical protein